MAAANRFIILGSVLSYTTFKFSNLKIEHDTISTDESTNVSVDVKNTGDKEGTEIVQLYIRDKFSSVVTPIIALKGYERVQLKANEVKKVTMQITPEKLSLWNNEMKRVVEPGEFEIYVGSSSRREDLQKAILIVK